MSMGRVLIVSNFFPPNSMGGAEVVAFRQAKLLRDIGWDVFIFAGDRIAADGRGTGRRWWRDTYEGFEVTRIAFRQAADLDDIDFRDTGIAAIFDKVLRRIGPQVVHFHNVAGLGADLIPQAKRFGAKPIVTLHDRWGFCVKSILLRNDLSPCSNFEECHGCVPALSMPEGKLPIRFRRDYIMHCLQSADALVAPSPQIAADYETAGIDRRKIEVLSSGIDLGSIGAHQRQVPGTVSFICAAYLGEHKGIDELARALTRLWGRRDLRGRWRMLIAGDGHLEERLREAIDEAGMDSAVVLLGRIPRPRLLSLLSDIHVMVLPSICPENEPVSLLEGLASGAALLGSRIGGIPNIIEDHVNGRLYDPREPGELAGLMAGLIEDPDRIVAYSRDNLRRRTAYDEAKTGLRLAALYGRPATAAAAPDILVVAGLLPPTESTMLDIEDAPAAISHRRIRFLWWRWMSPGDAGQAHRFWIFRRGRNPITWFRAWRIGGRIPASPHFTTPDGWRSPPGSVRP